MICSIYLATLSLFATCVVIQIGELSLVSDAAEHLVIARFSDKAFDVLQASVAAAFDLMLLA